MLSLRHIIFLHILISLFDYLFAWVWIQLYFYTCVLFYAAFFSSERIVICSHMTFFMVHFMYYINNLMILLFSYTWSTRTQPNHCDYLLFIMHWFIVFPATHPESLIRNFYEKESPPLFRKSTCLKWQSVISCCLNFDLLFFVFSIFEFSIHFHVSLLLCETAVDFLLTSGLALVRSHLPWRVPFFLVEDVAVMKTTFHQSAVWFGFRPNIIWND